MPGYATKAEIDNRVLKIYEMIVKGYSRAEIVQICTVEFNTKVRNIDKYIKKATDKIIENNKKNLEILRAEANTRYLSWMRSSESVGNISQAAYMQARMDKINGLEVNNADINLSGSVKIEPFVFMINGEIKEKDDKL